MKTVRSWLKNNQERRRLHVNNEKAMKVAIAFIGLVVSAIAFIRALNA